MAERSSLYSQLVKVWWRDRLLSVSSKELMAFGIANGPIEFAKNGSIRWTNAAIVSVLNREAQWIGLRFWLFLERFGERLMGRWSG